MNRLMLLMLILIIPALGKDREQLIEIAEAEMNRSVELHHGIFEIPFMSDSSIIFFYKHPYQEDSTINEVSGFLLVPTDSNSYKKTFIYQFPHEGGDPKITTVFRANADSDPEKELVVLCEWFINHRGIGTYGTYYSTYIFDDEIENDSLVFLEETANLVGSGLDGTSEGEDVSFEFKNAGAIKTRLKELGF